MGTGLFISNPVFFCLPIGAKLNFIVAVENGADLKYAHVADAIAGG